MVTIIASAAIALMIFAAIRYIYKEKKKGRACIGCPHCEACSKKMYVQPKDS